MTPIDRLYTKKQAAEILAMSTRQVDRKVASGELCAQLDERTVKFRESELLRYMADLPSREPRSA